ncbi:transglycosylase SLT domain-containing protein [Massilia sp. 9096]|uniref:transglycosylase SLT domain-containing protein n=1 Tax=Massilia sp. 9096 TaxID=1500894 RepID=UPI0009DDE02D
MASQPVTWSSVIKTARGVMTTAQHTLTVFGLSAVAMIALLYHRPDLAKRVSDILSPQHPAPAVVAARPSQNLLKVSAEPVEIANADDKAARPSRQQKYVTDWLSRRYRVAGDAANMLVSTAYSTAHEIKLDPLLILAVMGIESGLNPFAESPMGAQGLMQVMSKVHSDKFEGVGGAQAALNPVANIRVGALILKDYVTRTGSVEAGLKSYVGAGAATDDSGYGSKVLTEYHRLKQVASGKNVPTYFPPAPAPAATPAPATALAQKTPAAKHDAESAETARGASQGGETVAGL